MRNISRIALLLITALANRSSAADVSDLVQATTRQQVRPVLIRREFNPLLQVGVEAPRKAVIPPHVRAHCIG